MITQIENLPENALGFSYSGKVTGQDYETVIIPAVEKKAKAHKKMRILIRFEESFNEVNFKAAMDDAFIGFKHFGEWERVAIVSDHSTINHAIKAFGFIMPGSIRTFALSEFNNAMAWISEK